MSGFEATAAQFSMGAVVSRTFAILGRNLVAIGSVAVLMSLLTIVAEGGIAVALVALFPGQSRILIGIPAALLGLVLHSIVVGAVTRIAVADLDQRRVGLGPALATGLRLALPLMGLTIVLGFGVVLASFLLVVPGIMLAMRWLVATPVRVIEGPSITEALSRSAVLTKGHRWKLFGLTLAFVILSGLITFALGRVGIALGSGMEASTRAIAVGVIQVIGSAISSSISSTGVAVCYVELRRHVEGASFQDLAAVFA